MSSYPHHLSLPTSISCLTLLSISSWPREALTVFRSCVISSRRNFLACRSLLCPPSSSFSRNERSLSSSAYEVWKPLCWRLASVTKMNPRKWRTLRMLGREARAGLGCRSPSCVRGPIVNRCKYPTLANTFRALHSTVSLCQNGMC